MTGNKILDLIVFNHNNKPIPGLDEKFLDDLTAYKQDDKDYYILSKLQEALDGKIFQQFIKLAIQKGITDQTNINHILSNSNNHPSESLSEEEIKVINKNEHRTKILTKEEIEDYEIKGFNLFFTVPGHLIPKDDIKFYANIQLKRFIDAENSVGASDFIIETQKKEYKVYSKLMFQINGINEEQDKTEIVDIDYKELLVDETPEHLKEKNNEGKIVKKEDPNIFFLQVRKYITTELPKSSNALIDRNYVTGDIDFTLRYQGYVREFRVNNFPAVCYGEYYPRVCIRLTTDGGNADLSNFDIIPFMKKKLESLVTNDIAGLILVTGPTGSGKTTTLYGLIRAMDPRIGILTIENPIESYIEGINQSQEDATGRQSQDDNYNLDHFLKSATRQAPKVLLVGEIRNAEAAQKCTTIGLTGHKVLATYHTKSPIGTIQRFERDGIDRVTIGEGVDTIISQRLLGKLCPHCSKPVRPEKKEDIIKEINDMFAKSKRRFARSMKELLMGIEENNFDYEYVELFLEDELIKIVSPEDVKGILSIINIHKKTFENKKINKEKKIEKILEDLHMYPNVEPRQHFEDAMRKADIREKNKQGCKYCRQGYYKRDGIYEILDIDDTVAKYLQDYRKSLSDLDTFVITKGHIKIKMYGALRVLEGKIDWEDLISKVR